MFDGFRFLAAPFFAELASRRHQQSEARTYERAGSAVNVLGYRRNAKCQQQRRWTGASEVGRKKISSALLEILSLFEIKSPRCSEMTGC
jgi:hypothetical protein